MGGPRTLPPVVAATDPAYRWPDYRSTLSRGPSQPLVRIAPGEEDLTPITLSPTLILPHDADLTAQSTGAPVGERIVVSGRIVDEDGRPVRNSLVELWQCNAAGRYRHPGDQHDAPLDPHFAGFGKTLTDADGNYTFVTIKPGAYPWGNHANAWRPAHLHFSLFGNVHAQRLITQMYFPGDPLLALDPIYQSVPAPARARLIAGFDLGLTRAGVALGYRFDIVLRGRDATPPDR